MDSTTTQVLAVAGLFVSTVTGILGYLNHKRIRSKCCGEKVEASLDIEETTPPVRIERQKSFIEGRRTPPPQSV